MKSKALLQNVAAPRGRAIGILLLGLTTFGCRQDMHDQPKYEPFETSRFFADGQTARQPVEGTVARGFLREDDALYRGMTEAGTFVREFPIAVDGAVLERGRERYDIYCSVCHGRTGDGLGMIVQRGFKQPESFHQDRLREVEVGYFFDVMTNGFGQMSSYASQVSVEDRWAITAYVRTLQMSRQVDVATLSAAERDRIGKPIEQHQEAGHEADGHTAEAEGH